MTHSHISHKASADSLNDQGDNEGCLHIRIKLQKFQLFLNDKHAPFSKKSAAKTAQARVPQRNNSRNEYKVPGGTLRN